ncbi:hypothetical protein AVEN_183640-1 [Araneus ventricosus]|uniref:Uncharacterized protein n=1 Tax=Araneus ventricosus TaxID=182803 RepID=A0A4Y2SSP1_ARAVE|nr:hypothetical protein AVEN_183640-1 [Araneus ventricosus]
MAGKRDLQSFFFFTGGQGNEPDIGGKMKHLENAIIMALSLLGTGIWRTFERILCDVTPCLKAIPEFSNEDQSLFGVLSAVQAGELIDAESY